MPINYNGRLESAQAVQSVIGSAYRCRPYTAGPTYDPTVTDPSLYTDFASWVGGNEQTVVTHSPTTPADTVPIPTDPLTFTVDAGSSLPQSVLGMLLINHFSGLLVGVFEFTTPQVMSVVGQTLTINEQYNIGPLAP